MRRAWLAALVLLLVVSVDCSRKISVVVALDELGAQQLADDATATNKHSLRALWAQDDFWDIVMQHDCPGTQPGHCTFSNNLSQLEEADAVLFSAQIFPGLGRFEEVMRRVSPQQSTILWNTEAIDTFRLGTAKVTARCALLACMQLCSPQLAGAFI